jgi:hypothetical protein
MELETYAIHGMMLIIRVSELPHVQHWIQENWILPVSSFSTRPTSESSCVMRTRCSRVESGPRVQIVEQR